MAWQVQKSLEIEDVALKSLRPMGDLNDILPVSPKCLQARVTTSTLHVFQDKTVALPALLNTGGKKALSSGEAGSCWPSLQP